MIMLIGLVLMMMQMSITCMLLTPILFLVFIVVLRVYVRTFARTQIDEQGTKRPTVAFFHPYCNAGGGGERVLWCAIRALQKKYPNVDCIVYTGDIEAKSEEIVQKSRNRFNIVVPRSVEFVFLKWRCLVEAKTYPMFTLLGQSLGSILLGWEALTKFSPDIYIDSMGYAFTVPLFRYVGGCSVGCYVHYPTISTDMLTRVAERKSTYNNPGFVARNPILSRFKLFYYHMFAFLYGVVGARSDIVMVNSSWTYGHILSIWNSPSRTHVVYPPCDTKEFSSIKNIPDLKKKIKSIVSIAQFRPEKDHALQIRSFEKFLKKLSEDDKKLVRLELIGGCRNAEDRKRVGALKELCSSLGVSDQVEFLLSIPFEDLKEHLAQGTMGLHTMWNEHFGIGVVECMAAGTIIIAHNSGGPKMDIVIPSSDGPTGFLASDEDSYADAMEKVFRMSSSQRQEIRERARLSVERFSDDEFEKSFLAASEPLFTKVQ